MSKQFRYESSQSVIGTSADLLVNSQLGPSFVELGLRVYKGELRYVVLSKDKVIQSYTIKIPNLDSATRIQCAIQ